MKSMKISDQFNGFHDHSPLRGGETCSGQYHLKKIVVEIAKALGMSLYDLFFKPAEPIISERRDYDGTIYYQAYDPVEEKVIRFDLEEDVRSWLEQRYYKH